MLRMPRQSISLRAGSRLALTFVCEGSHHVAANVAAANSHYLLIVNKSDSLPATLLEEMLTSPKAKDSAPSGVLVEPLPDAQPLAERE